MILTYLSQLDLRLGWSSWWGVLRGMFVRDCRRVFMCRRSIVSSGVLVVSVPLGVCSRGPSQARTESTCVFLSGPSRPEWICVAPAKCSSPVCRAVLGASLPRKQNRNQTRNPKPAPNQAFRVDVL